MGIPDDIPGLGPKTVRPRPNPAADFIRHPLTPTDGFVLSRVDGVTSYEHLCSMTGLGAETTLEILRRLMKDGLILGGAPPAGQAVAAAVSPSAPVPLAALAPVAAVAPVFDAGPGPASPSEPTRELGSLLERLDDGSPVDEADLVPGPDLSRELKTRLLRVRRRLKTLSPYALLGVPAGTDRSAAKRAYFAASKEFHPDRFYGKDIGSFREVLGDIFTHLTRALQVIQADRQGDRDAADKK